MNFFFCFYGSALIKSPVAHSKQRPVSGGHPCHPSRHPLKWGTALGWTDPSSALTLGPQVTGQCVSSVCGLWNFLGKFQMGEWQGSGHATPNMAPWHMKYFKLKEAEKIADTGRSLWCPPDPSSLKQVTKPSCYDLERKILIYKDSVTGRRIQTNRFC